MHKVRYGFLSLLVCSSALLAQSSGGPYAFTRFTTDAGGGSASGNTYSITATIGQTDATAVNSSGGNYVLRGGFWGQADNDLIFKSSFD